MHSIDWRDLLGGLLVAAVGGAFALSASSLPPGDPGTVGPGYVPIAVGLIAVALGVVIAARSFLRSSPSLKIPLRPVLAVFAAVAVFAVLIGSTGLLPTLMATIVVSALGSRDSKPLTVLLLAITVSLACWLVFVVGLGLPIPVIRSPL